MARPWPAYRPADRDGVAASRVSVHGRDWDRAEDFLLHRLPRVTDWAQRLAQGMVVDARGEVVSAHRPCKAGETLWYWRHVAQECEIPFELQILYQDDYIVVVDKPHFLPAIPSGRYVKQTALVRLRQRLGLSTLAPVHRLDRETAGVMVFCVQPHTRAAYHQLMREHRMNRIYEAVAPWDARFEDIQICSCRIEERPDLAFMQMQVVEGPPNAITHISLMQRSADLGLYRLEPRTGRKHQLRVQMSHLGVPIVGDRIYPTLWPHQPLPKTDDWGLPLQLLARSIEFDDPISGHHHHIVSLRQLSLTAS